MKISRITGIVKQLTILTGWACALVALVGFFVGVTGTLVYVVFKVDAMHAEMVSMVETQKIDTLTISKYLNDLKIEVRAKRKSAEK